MMDQNNAMVKYFDKLSHVAYKLAGMWTASIFRCDTGKTIARHIRAWRGKKSWRTLSTYNLKYFLASNTTGVNTRQFLYSHNPETVYHRKFRDFVAYCATYKRMPSRKTGIHPWCYRSDIMNDCNLLAPEHSRGKHVPINVRSYLVPYKEKQNIPQNVYFKRWHSQALCKIKSVWDFTFLC